jgi:hypothetical protein
MFRTGMTLDRANRILTFVVSAVVLFAAVWVLAARPRFGGLPLALTGAVLLCAWAMSPRALIVDAGELQIVRRAWPSLRVPLAEIATAEPLDRLGAGTLRLFGVGGFFGSYGLFANAALGRFRLYATRRGPAVLLRRRSRQLPLVLTPDDAAGTLRALLGELGPRAARF